MPENNLFILRSLNIITQLKVLDFLFKYFAGNVNLQSSFLYHTPIGVCPPLLCPLFDKQWIDMIIDETKNPRG